MSLICPSINAAPGTNGIAAVNARGHSPFIIHIQSAWIVIVHSPPPAAEHRA